MESVGLVRPVLVFYGGLIAIGLVLSSMRMMHFELLSTYVCGALVAFVVFCVLWSQAHMRSVLIERCLKIDRRQMQVQLLLSTVLLPLYPVLALPFVVVSSVMMTMGQCSL